MSDTNGVAYSVFDKFYGTWPSNTQTWKLTLPMIQCGSSPPGPSNVVVGAVNVEIFWMTMAGADPDFLKVPTSFDVPATFGTETTYTCSATEQATTDGRQKCWLRFLNDFNVKDASGNALTQSTAADLYVQKSIYFAPSCTLSSLGGSGPTPSSVIAKYPRLVH